MNLARAFANPRFRLLVWAILGAAGWLGLALLAALGLASTPPKAGFDLFLILDAGRRVAAGQSPYELAGFGAGTQAESLFYSYPPPVAQAASLVAGVPEAVVFWIVTVGAVAGLAVAAAALARRLRPAARALDVVVPTIALAPYVFPFAVALVFGNADAWYPLVFGLLLVGVLGRVSGDASGPALLGGVALALAAIAKLQPGALLLWLAIWGLRARRTTAGSGSNARKALGAAVATLVLIVGLSLLVWGIGPWQDYVALVRSGTSADLVSPLNIGPASQLALLTGDDSLARTIAPFVAAIALAVIAVVAWLRRDPIESLALATTASLIVTPITWFHYPVALIPFGIAAWARVRARAPDDPALAGRRGRVALLLVGAIVVAGLSILLPVVVWLAVVPVLIAVRLTGPLEND